MAEILAQYGIAGGALLVLAGVMRSMQRERATVLAKLASAVESNGRTVDTLRVILEGVLRELQGRREL